MNAVRSRLRDRLSEGLRDDRGFTFVEMMVASMLFAMVITGIIGIIVTTMQTQTTVTAVSTSTTDAQSIASQIEKRIRNSSEFQVTTSGTTQLLVARVAGSGATISWRCYGWYYTAANGGSIRMTSTATGTKITMPTADQAATWTLLADGVTPRSGSTVFSATGSLLTVAFNTTTGDTRPVAISFTTARLTGVSESLTCY